MTPSVPSDLFSAPRSSPASSRIRSRSAAEAFAHTWRFITGRDPITTAITPEPRVVLDGVVTGSGPGGPTNLPLVGATVEVYAVDASTGARRGGRKGTDRGMAAKVFS